MAKNIHVTHREDGSWAIIREKAKQASGLYDTQREAIELAREMARKGRVELVIHDRENRIRDKDSYGNDPCPPRDTKY